MTSEKLFVGRTLSTSSDSRFFDGKTLRVLSAVFAVAGLPCIGSPVLAARDLPLSSVSNDSSSLQPSSRAYMDQGKALFENGQYMAALGKFMSVLKTDSTNAEARKYLRRVIDAMRQTPASSAAGKKALETSAVSEQELQRFLEKRARLTVDLKAIPGLTLASDGNAAQVIIETSMLFTDKTGGLRDQGIPTLDRVAAWLGTFGQQPVIVHCYPEELQDPAVNGSLFLHRYSELYNFFVDERRMNPQRFVSADLLGQEDPTKSADLSQSSGTAHVVIETVGSQASLFDDTEASAHHGKKAWIEFSLYSSRSRAFNPEEGEWASLDLSALNKNGLTSWKLVIVPTTKDGPGSPVMTLKGKGNVLMRMNWDGRNDKTGSFVSSGHYTARFTAIDSEGVPMTPPQEMVLQVRRKSQKVDLDVPRPSATTVHHRDHAKSKKTVSKTTHSHTSTASPAAPSAVKNTAADEAPIASTTSDKTTVSPSPTAAASSGDDSLTGHAGTPVATAPAAETPAPSATTETDSASDSTHAIWKQVILFNTDSTDLAPTLKASLERIGKTLEVYPLQKVRILGFAVTSETDAESLAKQRAEAVRTILVNEYHVDKKRVLMAGGKTSADPSASKVELSITN